MYPKPAQHSLAHSTCQRPFHFSPSRSCSFLVLSHVTRAAPCHSCCPKPPACQPTLQSMPLLCCTRATHLAEHAAALLYTGYSPCRACRCPAVQVLLTLQSRPLSCCPRATHLAEHAAAQLYTGYSPCRACRSPAVHRLLTLQSMPLPAVQGLLTLPSMPLPCCTWATHLAEHAAALLATGLLTLHSMPLPCWPFRLAKLATA